MVRGDYNKIIVGNNCNKVGTLSNILKKLIRATNY